MVYPAPITGPPIDEYIDPLLLLNEGFCQWQRIKNCFETMTGAYKMLLDRNVGKKSARIVGYATYTPTSMG